MRKVTAFESVSLDGVMQAPGRPDEDTRGGFEHGGWGLPYSDPVMGQVAGASMAAAPDLLFGRRTYEDFYSMDHMQPSGSSTGVVIATYEATK